MDPGKGSDMKLTASNWRERSADLLELRPAGKKTEWRTTVNDPAPPRRPAVVDLTNDDSSAANSPKASANDVAVARKVSDLMESFDTVNVKPQWKRASEKVKKKVRSVMDMLTRNSADELTESEEEPEEEVETNNKVDGLDVTLLPHQVEGLAWLLSREEGKAKGGILADDMGLGKTIQSIGLILSHPHPQFRLTKSAQTDGTVKNPDIYARTTLIVAPLGLIKQWEAELQNRTTSLPRKIKVMVHHGPSRSKDKNVLAKHDVVITTYAIVASEYKNLNVDNPNGLFGVQWWRIILDEAHSIKNPSAKGSQAAFALRARNRWCLTGTPIQNNLTELQSLIRFLRIAPYDEMPYWKDHIMMPMKAGPEGEAKAMERLKLILSLILLRRTKKNIAAQEKKDQAVGSTTKPKPGTISMNLPERTVKSVICKFSPGEQQFYEKLEDKTGKKLEQMQGKDLNYTHALVLLLRLRQACNHPQLLAGKLQDDSEALTAVKPTKKTVEKDVDALADIMGGLSVEAKSCDICLEPLSRAEISKRAVRCKGCTEDLNGFKVEKRRESLDALKHHEEKQKEKERRRREQREKERKRLQEKERLRKERAAQEAAREKEASRSRLIKKGSAAPGASRRRVIVDDEDDDEDFAPQTTSTPPRKRYGVRVASDDESDTEVVAHSRARSHGTQEAPITLESDEDDVSYPDLGKLSLNDTKKASPTSRPKKRRDSFIEYDTDEEPEESESEDYEDDDSGNRGGMFDSQAEESDGPESDGEFNQSIISHGSQAGVSGDDSGDDSQDLDDTGESLKSFVVPDRRPSPSRKSHLPPPSSSFKRSSRPTTPTQKHPLMAKRAEQSEIFPSTKIIQLLKILDKESHNKTIVFSQFTSMLDLIEPFLRKAHIPFARYDGSMPNQLREDSLHRLKTSTVSECPVLLCSLKCGAVGLNLTAACRVVIVEPFWNPAIEEQAIDRVHRFGQTKDVVVYKLSIEGSVEERVLELQEEKRRLIEAAIGEGSLMTANKLGMREIMKLFKKVPQAMGATRDRSAQNSSMPPPQGRTLPVGFRRY